MGIPPSFSLPSSLFFLSLSPPLPFFLLFVHRSKSRCCSTSSASVADSGKQRRQQKISNKSFRNPASLLSASPDFHYSLLCHLRTLRKLSSPLSSVALLFSSLSSSLYLSIQPLHSIHTPSCFTFRYFFSICFPFSLESLVFHVQKERERYLVSFTFSVWPSIATSCRCIHGHRHYDIWRRAAFVPPRPSSSPRGPVPKQFSPQHPSLQNWIL